MSQSAFSDFPPDFSHESDQEEFEPKPLRFLPTKRDEDFWDAFPPDDEIDPLPEQGDFWVEQDQLRLTMFAA